MTMTMAWIKQHYLSWPLAISIPVYDDTVSNDYPKTGRASV